MLWKTEDKNFQKEESKFLKIEVPIFLEESMFQLCDGQGVPHIITTIIINIC